MAIPANVVMKPRARPRDWRRRVCRRDYQTNGTLTGRAANLIIIDDMMDKLNLLRAKDRRSASRSGEKLADQILDLAA